MGFEPVTWVEAIPEIYDEAKKRLEKYPKQTILNAVLGEKDNERVAFYIAGTEFSSSSILEPYLIQASHPGTELIEKRNYTTVTLDTLVSNNLNALIDNSLMILDLQGAELQVLKGATNTLNKIGYIITEVSIRKLYKKNDSFKQLRRYLHSQNYLLVRAEINYTTGWGEALFIRKDKTELDFNSSQNVINYTNKRKFLGTFVRIIVLKIPYLKKFYHLFSWSKQ